MLNFDFSSEIKSVFLYVKSCSLVRLLCVGISSEENKNKRNNASLSSHHIGVTQWTSSNISQTVTKIKESNWKGVDGVILT